MLSNATAKSIPWRVKFTIETRLAIRWSLLVAGLVGEGTLLTVAFESPAASARDDWPVRLASLAPDLIRIGAAAVIALLVLLMPRLRATVATAGRCAAEHRWHLWLLLHVLSFALLYLLVGTVGPGQGSEGKQSAGLELCEALSVVWVFLWFLALAPYRYWRMFIAAEYRAILAAFAVAAAAWLGGEVSQNLWKPLAAGTFALAEQLLRLGYPEVVSDPSRLVLGTPRFLVQIAPQCSGYEGVSLVTVFVALYFWLFRRRIRFPHGFLLFPVAAVAAWLANVLRIAALVAIGSSYSQAVAQGGFHSQAGWISFIGVAVAVIAVTHRMAFFSAVRPDRASAAANPIAAAMLVPFLVLLASTMFTGAVSERPDALYPLRILVVAAALFWFVRIYVKWDWSWSWASVLIGAVVFVLWIALDDGPAGDRTPLANHIAMLGQIEAAIWIAFRVVGSSFLVPLVEEMAFRGYLLRRLTTANLEAAEANAFRWVSFLVSSVAFGLLHGRWIAGTAAGMAYAAAAYRRGKLADAIVAHMTTNGLIALLVLIGGYWSLWS